MRNWNSSTSLFLTKILILIACLFVGSPSYAQQVPSFVFNTRHDAFPNQYDQGIKPMFWNDGVVFLGFCADTGLTQNGMTVTFYDTVGNLHWSHTFFSNDYDIIQGNDMIALDDNSFYVTGIAYVDTI